MVLYCIKTKILCLCQVDEFIPVVLLVASGLELFQPLSFILNFVKERACCCFFCWHTGSLGNFRGWLYRTLENKKFFAFKLHCSTIRHLKATCTKSNRTTCHFSEMYSKEYFSCYICLIYLNQKLVACLSTVKISESIL